MNRSGPTPSPVRLPLAIRPMGRTPRALIRASGGWAEDVSDVEIVSAIQELAETEGIFTETAGGVTTAVTARLYAHGRIKPDELTVSCITGNGLKTTDCLHGRVRTEPRHSSAAYRFRKLCARNAAAVNEDVEPG